MIQKSQNYRQTLYSGGKFSETWKRQNEGTPEESPECYFWFHLEQGLEVLAINASSILIFEVRLDVLGQLTQWTEFCILRYPSAHQHSHVLMLRHAHLCKAPTASEISLVLSV